MKSLSGVGKKKFYFACIFMEMIFIQVKLSFPRQEKLLYYSPSHKLGQVREEGTVRSVHKKYNELVHLF